MLDFIYNNYEAIAGIISIVVWEIIGRRKETKQPAATPLNLVSKLADTILKDRKTGGGAHIKGDINNK